METINTANLPVQESNQPIEAPVQPKPVTNNVPVKMNSKMKIGLGVLFFLVLFNVVVLLFKSKTNPAVAEPSPQAIVIPSATTSGIIKNQSEFSKLPEYILFEQNLKDTITVNDGLDLSNSKLNFPLLEMKVNFSP